jgi:PadR family transcriptional regulator, regulatory protein PadR
MSLKYSESKMDAENILNKKFLKEMNSGISSLVLLAVMEQGAEPMYGYQVSKLLEAGATDETQLIKQGALYPVLRSLEKRGLLSSEVEPSVSGPPRRYYSITESGKNALIDWVEIWSQTKIYVDTVLQGE